MKTLGLIGGMSWESTAIYYRLINQAAKTRRGSLEITGVSRTAAHSCRQGRAKLAAQSLRRLRSGATSATPTGLRQQGQTAIPGGREGPQIASGATRDR